MAFDPATGEESVVVELNPLTEEALGLTAGGTYDVVLDAARRRLFVGLNAAPVDQREDTTFGQVVLAEITLPVGADGTAARADDAGRRGGHVRHLRRAVGGDRRRTGVGGRHRDERAGGAR